ncbi:hypothetical protein N7470_007380 [Penicillium chermesinum]|nr:hypothetical protein N7470_007380 [Penicillium chermesinum]
MIAQLGPQWNLPVQRLGLNSPLIVAPAWIEFVLSMSKIGVHLNWETRTNGNRHVLHELPSGKIYADGFVRQVDVREVRPVESPNNPRAQPGMIVQASRHRVPDQYAQEGSHNHNQSSSESPLPVPWATSLSYPLPLIPQLVKHIHMVPVLVITATAMHLTPHGKFL